MGVHSEARSPRGGKMRFAFALTGVRGCEAEILLQHFTPLEHWDAPTRGFNATTDVARIMARAEMETSERIIVRCRLDRPKVAACC